MEEAKTKNGLIGFFDILGYQSFLENNDVDTAVGEVLDTINNMETIVKNDIIRGFKEPDDRGKAILNNIEWRVFSDTILISMEWNAMEPNLYEWVVFCSAAIKLCRHMFDNGLSIRGAIKNGKYVISDSCFAGRVIVDAHHSETSLNLAGCSIDEKLLGVIKEKEARDCVNVSDTIAVRYMTPLKDGQYEKRFLLNYFLPDDDMSPKPHAVDISQLVLNSFWGHRKDLTASSELKARNTEHFLRFLFHRFPFCFASTEP